MLLSIAIMLLFGMALSEILKKIHLPPLLGMIIAGIILGPHALHLLHRDLLSISGPLREIALIIILSRAGLTLKVNDLKKVGRPAILMGFIPAIFEIGAMVIFAPKFFEISISEAALLGSVIAAVSPAVIVPKMITIIEEGYGAKKSIPQMILAAASVDDVFVIVLFTSFLALSQGEIVSVLHFSAIPLSILIGIIVGVICGFALSIVFKKIHLRDSQKVLIVLSIGFLLLTLENILENIIPFSALIAIMSLGIALKAAYPMIATRLSAKFSKLWVFAEIMLFVLVGASVDVRFAVQAGGSTLIVLFCVLIFRMLGVWVCLLKTNLEKKERIFCMISYIPKATVQAAIGAIPLSLGLASGEIIVTIAVVSILITAPLGAILIEKTYKKLLS